MRGRSFLFGGAGMDFTHLTSPERAKALAKLANGYSISAAMRAAGYTRQTYYNWRADGTGFDSLADEALEMGTDALEDDARLLAKRGNATIMAIILKARRPDKYRDRVDINIQVRKKAEQMADALGIPVDELEQEAFAIARNAWDQWPHQP
jgi:hypothetical protein